MTGNKGDEPVPPTELAGWTLDQLDYPTFRLTLIAKIMDRLTIRYLTEEGIISYAEWRVMARLATMTNGGTVRQVADLAWVDRAEVSRAVTQLESKGFTARRENPMDGRAPLLHMTEKGFDYYRAGLARRRAFHESLLVNLSPEEAALLDDLLGRVGEQLVHLLKAG